VRRQLGILRNAVGVELGFDPLLNPKSLNRFDVAWPGSEGQPIERVQDFLILGERLIELAVIGRVRGDDRDTHQSQRQGELLHPNLPLHYY